ncbi:hypothetical protein Q3A66_17075 [Hymenobacter sp. BT770]|uniref:hypothetical protein n=1 Tax=Hymenobacter sp. BT770 TaxID=2886942 RepID=UPI001D1143A9|nr:hypothetical protein [Hymenobacter sp. BT770]MCC3154842.1 hypothetical protein [Hymenobacter sp. BT770]MDO3416783.1 hypothetical protein [Hymenobacter sp. BT770]
METFFLVNRYLHITAGFIGFFVAPVALAVRKGGVAHRRWGKVFFWAMAVAGTTALVGAQHIHSLFLLLTAVFSLYMAGFGYRSLFLKHLAWDARVATFDWVVAGVGLVVFLGTVAYAFVAGNIPVGVFGALGASTAVRQLRGYANAGKLTKNQWLLNHISGFLASYIAAVSAFSVTSLRFIPFPYNFLWPTLLGVPVILWWHRRVRSQPVRVAPIFDLSGSPAPALRK